MKKPTAPRGSAISPIRASPSPWRSSITASSPWRRRAGFCTGNVSATIWPTGCGCPAAGTAAGCGWSLSLSAPRRWSTPSMSRTVPARSCTASPIPQRPSSACPTFPFRRGSFSTSSATRHMSTGTSSPLPRRRSRRPLRRNPWTLASCPIPSPAGTRPSFSPWMSRRGPAYSLPTTSGGTAR